jgi:hypothetical protein
MQATHKSRIIRVQILREEAKTKKKMLRDDLTKYAMNRWMVSRQIADRYVNELIFNNYLRLTVEDEKTYVEYVE